MSNKSSDSVKSKMQLFLNIAEAKAGEEVELDERTAFEIVTDSLTDLADEYSWDLMGIDKITFQEIYECVEFVFERGRHRVTFAFDQETGTFVNGSVTSTLMKANDLVDVFRQLGDNRN